MAEWWWAASERPNASVSLLRFSALGTKSLVYLGASAEILRLAFWRTLMLPGPVYLQRVPWKNLLFLRRGSLSSGLQLQQPTSAATWVAFILSFIISFFLFHFSSFILVTKEMKMNITKITTSTRKVKMQ